MSSFDSMGEKENGEEKEQEAVARVLSRFKPKEVRRKRETNQWRRRTSQQDRNKDFLIERLRLINLLTNEASSSSSSSTAQKQQIKTSFISLFSPTQSQPLRTNLQQHKGKSVQEAKSETEMIIITKSFPFDHRAKINESSDRYSNQIPFSDKGRYMFANPNCLAPAVQIRTVIPVFAAPPSKPNPNPNPNPSSLSSSVNDPTSINSGSVPKYAEIGRSREVSCEMIKLGLESEILDQTHD